MKQEMKTMNFLHNQIAGNYQSLDYLLYLIAYYSAPVLEADKPAVTLNFGSEIGRRLNEIWTNHHDKIPCSVNFRFYELRRTPEQSIVLFYNPDLLQNVLREKPTTQFLIRSGYRAELTVETALADLKERFSEGCPHEIGVFLGIPLPDVLSFIDNKGKKALIDGYWKVYHDPGPKLALFERYREAKHCFLNMMMEGKRPGDYFADKLIICTE